MLVKFAGIDHGEEQLVMCKVEKQALGKLPERCAEDRGFVCSLCRASAGVQAA